MNSFDDEKEGFGTQAYLWFLRQVGMGTALNTVGLELDENGFLIPANKQPLEKIPDLVAVSNRPRNLSQKSRSIYIK